MESNLSNMNEIRAPDAKIREKESEKGDDKKYWYKDVVPAIAMAAVECSNVIVNILFKAASSKRLSFYVFLAYIYALAVLVLLPLTFFLVRKTRLPPFKFPLISRLCLLGLVGYVICHGIRMVLQMRLLKPTMQRKFQLNMKRAKLVGLMRLQGSTFGSSAKESCVGCGLRLEFIISY
ncbi:hypothetical protein PTKIN_Ptkin08bG0038900 [Pterospermum kingtungense]